MRNSKQMNGCPRDLAHLQKRQRLDNFLEARARSHGLGWFDIENYPTVGRWAGQNKHRWFFAANADMIRIPNLNRSRHYPRARDYKEARKIAMLRGVNVQRKEVA